jgi:hypothetical protein
MALANFLRPGTYSNLHDVRWCKHSKHASAVLKVWLDAAQSQLLFEYPLFCNGAVSYQSVKSASLIEPPANPEEEDWYLVPVNATGDWADHAGKAARWQGGAWVMGDWITDLFVEDTQTYYRKTKVGWSMMLNAFDARMWDQWFSSDVVFADGSNIVKQFYSYLKTRDDFAGVLDC